MNRLIELRRQRGLNIEEMAARIKIQPRTLIELESGARAMEPEAIPVFMRRLDHIGFVLIAEPPRSAT
ncbi:MAG: helix-turn-helix domain-containing protein [Desulfomonilaceae bacterium]